MSDTWMSKTRLALPVLALLFLMGVCFLQLQADLHGPVWTGSEMLMLLPLCMWLFYRLPCKRGALAFLLGYLWALLFAHLYLQHKLPDDLIGQDILIEGIVSGLPHNNDKSVRFDFQVKHYISINGANSHLLTGHLPSRLRLSWYYNKNEILSGQTWRLQVRLKPPHGMQNPGGFDYEKWLYQQGIHATGYIRDGRENKLTGSSTNSVVAIRESLKLLLSNLPDSSYQGLLQALTIGHKSEISSKQWQVLRHTGTSHLMAISGLHIGLVAGLVFLIVSRLIPAISCKYISASQIAAVTSLCVAGFYAALAGFTVPTQRAFIMLLVFMLAILIKRPALSLNTLSLALIAVIVINPVSVLSVGFWLSFVAVIIISVVSAYRLTAHQGKINTWIQGIRIQWLIALGMFPLSLLLFQQGSFISPLANMIVIPLVGMIIVPMLLLASSISLFSADLSVWLFSQTSGVFSLAWVILEWLANIPFSNWQHSAVPLFHALLAITGVALLLMPKGFPLRYSGFVLLLPMALYEYPRPEQGAFWVDVLDVGQGLSVLVQTKDNVLLYDTGSKFSENFDIGQRVVVPYLNYLGYKSLDVLMISHSDNDHMGGADSVLEMISVKKLLAESAVIKQKDRINTHDKACKQGQNWVWNDVNFEVLHGNSSYKKNNNRSCVLKVWNESYSLLLPGDIEQKAERGMLNLDIDKLKTDVLLMPHHGSNTSSSKIWLDKIKPQLAIASAGYKNRFGHPTAKVINRYQKRGSQLLNTANSGLIHLKLPVNSDQSLTKVLQHRKVTTHYWNHSF